MERVLLEQQEQRPDDVVADEALGAAQAAQQGAELLRAKVVGGDAITSTVPSGSMISA
jgi:hypothetical protein